MHTQRVISLLKEAADMIAADEDSFERALEEMVTRVQTNKSISADITCSMLYAASEAIRYRDA